jgi:geranylgeranyl reductase family protein
MSQTDIAVVGGGPAGTLSALNLAKNGYKISLFEEHQSAGFPVQCAGLVSEDCIKLLKSYVNPDRFLLNSIHGAYFFSPSGDFIKVKGKTRAAVVERKLMDTELLKAASSVAEIFVKEKVLSVNLHGDSVYLKTSRSNYSSKYIVGADGVYSKVARDLKFERPKILSAIQLESRFECMDEKYVELYFGREYSDFFFGYAVPTGDEFARIGVVSKNNAFYWINKLLREHPSVSQRVECTKSCELNCGAIPFGLVDFVKKNAVLIGDSAGMVKPYTGGGIYYLALAAECLGEHFPDLEEFRSRYLQKLGKEYRFGYKIARLYRELSDEDYEYLIGVAEGIRFEELHMDMPTTVLKVLPAFLKLLRNPKLSLRIAKCLL